MVACAKGGAVVGYVEFESIQASNTLSGAAHAAVAGSEQSVRRQAPPHTVLICAG